MGLFNLFANKKELCKTDDCINKTMHFIKVISSYDGLDCPMFNVSFGDNSISFYFYDSDNSKPCICKTMLHRNQADEDTVNLMIGKAIHADELPNETTLEWHFDDEKNMYDYYVLRCSITTEHKKCGATYLGHVKNLCEQIGLQLKVNGSCLDFEFK